MKIQNESESVILPIPTEELIKSFEEFWGMEFPKEYKEFIKVYNGAIPKLNKFICKDKEYLIKRFLCLLEFPNDYEIEGWYDIGVVLSDIDTRLMDDEDLVGANVIPIAILDKMDFVCLDFRANDNPCVSVWNNKESDILKPVLSKVADNVTEFFNMLY